MITRDSLSHLLIGICALAVLHVPRAAHAQESAELLIVPLDRVGTSGDEKLPRRLTRVLRGIALQAGIEASLSTAPWSEMLSLTGCAADAEECLHKLPGMMGASRILFGTVEAKSQDAAGITIKLGIVSAHGPQLKRTIFLPQRSDRTFIDQFLPQAKAFIEGREPASRKGPTLVPAGGESGAESFSFGNVGGLAWGLSATTVAVLGTATTFLVLANGKQSDVNSAPNDTVEDLQRLRALEQDGQRFNRWGHRLVLAGGALAAVSLVFIYVQGQPSSEKPSIAVAPAVLGEGLGAGVVVTFGWQP